MKAKREAKRMCTGCGEMFDKRTLVRVVKSPEGEISLDLTGKKNGRGAYVCNNPE
ncbi:MAG: YlxR family protein, partial [Eubacterium sp.]|nr:YlxR family protein [Eubacterium sp.]